MENGQKRSIEVDVTNTDRAFGTILGSEITRNHTKGHWQEDTYRSQLYTVQADRALVRFIPKGLTLELGGDSNDYFGKGLSGGKLDRILRRKEAAYKAEENIIIGNVALYGATSGTAFINGMAGERFCST